MQGRTVLTVVASILTALVMPISAGAQIGDCSATCTWSSDCSLDCVDGSLLNTCGGYGVCDYPPPPPCITDTCDYGVCDRPSAGVYGDDDSIPDRLEYDLAHKFFPHLKLQHEIPDLDQAYLSNGLTVPFTVTALPPRDLCNETFECLQIRYGLAYRNDCGDFYIGEGTNHCDTSNSFPNYGHPGDSEFYAVLVIRDTSWSTAKSDASHWKMIRDFTAAHWQDSGESSAYGWYGYLQGTSCSKYDSNQSACNAVNECTWLDGLCDGGYAADGSACYTVWGDVSCALAGGDCFWDPPVCIHTVSDQFESSTPASGPATLHASEGKHGTYHSDSDCNGGGFGGFDQCPTDDYDLRDSLNSYNLQNVGPATSGNWDSTVQSPISNCSLYDIWSGASFGDASSYQSHFNYVLYWNLP